MLHLNMSFSLATIAFSCARHAALHRLLRGSPHIDERTEFAPPLAPRGAPTRCQTRPSHKLRSPPTQPRRPRCPCPFAPRPASPNSACSSLRACVPRRCRHPTWWGWRRPRRPCSDGRPTSAAARTLSRPLSATRCRTGPTRSPVCIPGTSSGCGPASSAMAVPSAWRRPRPPPVRGKSSSRARA
ncbi:hypothetical protein D9M72_570600 [compost metagenome]